MNQSISKTEGELAQDQEFLKGTINTATTLYTMVHNKKNEIQLLKEERDIVLQSIEKVKFNLIIVFNSILIYYFFK